MSQQEKTRETTIQQDNQQIYGQTSQQDEVKDNQQSKQVEQQDEEKDNQQVGQNGQRYNQQSKQVERQDIKTQKSQTLTMPLSTYERMKRFVIREERDNYNSIYVLPSVGSKGWHETGDHSALIYYYLILKNRTKKPKFTHDVYSGYYNHYEFGRISIRSIDDIIHNLVANKIKFRVAHLDDKGRNTTSPICITRIRFSSALTDEKMEKLVNMERNRRKNCLRVPRADALDPNLYMNITELAATLNHLMNKNFNALARAELAREIVGQTNGIVRSYLEICQIASYMDNVKSRIKHEAANEKILDKYRFITKELNNLEISIAMAYTYHYIDVDNSIVISDKLFSVRDQINKSVQTINKQMRKAAIQK
ncbi:hypothetical protein IKE72_01960 [Candidatus Saccharibacteria bacterium]|nr:hypothetical protein [Candidatus Saccharibacteria bacterium]